MSDLRRTDRSDLCSDSSCRYRDLYAGSQTSLADMAGKQASALQAVSLMKRRISDLIKQNYPAAHSRAERSLGHRFADAETDIILAYLEQLVSSSAATVGALEPAPEPAGADLLRAALRRAGFAVSDDIELSAWAETVERTSISRPAEATPPPPAPRMPEPEAALDDLFEGLAGRAARESYGGAESVPVRDADGFEELDDLFDAPTTKLATPPVAVRGPIGDDVDDLFDPPTSDAAVAPDDDLDDLFGDSGPAAPATADELDDLFGDSPAPAGVDELDDLFGDAPTPTPVGVDELDDLFGDGGSFPPVQPTPVSAPPSFAGGDLDDLFDDAEPCSDAVDALDDLFGDDPPSLPDPASAADLDDLFGDHDATPPVDTSPGGLDDLFGEEPRPEPAPGPAPAPSGWSAPNAEALTVPIRPELVAGRSTRKRKPPRAPRTRAERPDPTRDLDPQADQADVEPDIRTRIEASVAIPRPVFVSDLIAVAGSREVLDSWSQEMHDLGPEAPVSFSAAKSRHKALGALVMPRGALRVAATEFNSSWWAQVLDKYKGAPLYELAVLLSRIGDQVQSTDLWDHTARFRLDTPRGLVGVVAHLGGGLGEGDAGREELADALEGFTRERLTLVAALSIVAGPAALTELCEAVAELAEARSWRPAYPVIGTHTWEWAANSGRTATLILGG